MVRKRRNLIGKRALRNQPAAGRRSGVTWDDRVGNKSCSLDETDDLEDKETSRSQSWQSSPERSLKEPGELLDALQDLKTDLDVHEIRRPAEELHKSFRDKNGFKMSLFVFFTFGAIMAVVSLVSPYKVSNTDANLWVFWGFNITSTADDRTAAWDTPCSLNQTSLSPSKVPPESVKVSSEEVPYCRHGSPSAVKNGPVFTAKNVLQDGSANSENAAQDEPTNLTDTTQDGLTSLTDTLQDGLTDLTDTIQHGPANTSGILQASQDGSTSTAAPLKDNDSVSSAIQDKRANLPNPSQNGDKNAAKGVDLAPPSSDEPLTLEKILELEDNGYPLPAVLDDDIPSQGTRMSLSPAPPNDGGWRTDEDDVTMYAIRRCDFDVRYADQMSSEEFESTYRNRKPVLLRFRGGARDWTDPDVWTRDGLVSRYGDRQVRTGYPPDTISNDGIGDDNERLDAYLTRYLDDELGFDSKYLTDRTLMTELLSHIRLPPYLNQSHLEEPVFRLFLGRSGTGLSWHVHKQAWNGVMFGAKRWFISAPDRPPPGKTCFEQLDWMKYVHPYVRAPWRPLECLQQAGDVVYIPEDFHHAVLNIGDTVAMSFTDESRGWKLAGLVEEVTRFLQYAEMAEEGAAAEELDAELEQMLGKLKASLRVIGEIHLEHELHGLYHLLRQRPRDAIALFNVAITADPFHLKAYIQLASVYSTLGQYDKAEETYLSALYLHSTSHAVWLAYGGFLEQRGNFTAAEQAYKKALLARPRWPWLYRHLARVQAKLGKDQDLRVTMGIYWYLKHTT